MSSARVWFLSPSVATAIFFSIQIVLSLTTEDRGHAISTAAADAPSAVPVQVRVVAEIRPLSRATKAAKVVPTTESELFELLDRDGAVTFGAEEVDVLATPAHDFAAGEVDVIRAAGRLRSAKLAPRITER